MTKILKVTSLVLGSIILLLLLSFGMLVAFVSPNKLKPIITSQVLKYTGRQLTIDGNLSWSFFPYLGVKVGHMALNNPAGFKENTFVEIDHATVGVKVLPLLHAKIESSGIALAGVKLNLIKNTDGQTNWQNLRSPEQVESTEMAVNNATAAPISDEKVVQKQKDSSPMATDKKSTISLDIPSVDVTDARIAWIDEQAKQSTTIDKMELHAKNISLDHAFSLATSFDFAVKNPAKSGRVSLDGKIKLDMNKQVYLMNDVDLAVTVHQNNDKDLATTIKGDIAADLLKQTFKINNIVGRFANVTLNGQVGVADLNTNPQVTGHIQTQPFDLKQLLQAIGQDSTSLQVAKDVTADFDFSATPPKAVASHDDAFAALQGVSFKGKIRMAELQAAKLRATHIVVNTQLQNRTVEFTPVIASLYQGSLQGQAKINLTTVVPQIALQAKLINVQAEPLLQDLGSQGSKLKIKGAGNIELQVTTAGTSGAAILQNLNGTSQFSFMNGQLDGVNIGYLIDSAYAFAKQKPAPATTQDVTNFGALTGTAEIHNGVVTNKDLFLDSPRFSTAGQGTIDLVKQRLDYQLQVMSKQKDKNPNDQNPLSLNNLAIPVRITGDFSNPNVRLDTQAIAEMVAKQQVHRVENKIKERIQDKIKGQIPGQAGALLDNLLGS